MTARKTLSWKPVLRKNGNYCSPACGGSCTHADYLKAVVNGKKLAKALGPRWKPYIWENMGWHYSAELGEHAKVYGRGDDLHGLWMSLMFGGKQIVIQGVRPETLVRKAIRAGQALVKEANRTLELLQGLK